MVYQKHGLCHPGKEGLGSCKEGSVTFVVGEACDWLGMGQINILPWVSQLFTTENKESADAVPTRFGGRIFAGLGPCFGTVAKMKHGWAREHKRLHLSSPRSVIRVCAACWQCFNTISPQATTELYSVAMLLYHLSRNYCGIDSFSVSETQKLRFGARKYFSQRLNSPELTVRQSLKSPGKNYGTQK